MGLHVLWTTYRARQARRRAELDAMLAEHGEVLVHDDLSNHEYRLSADDVAALFTEPAAEPRTLH